MKIVAKARQMAADGSGRQPRYLAPVAYDATARRQYSFSRLTGKLHAQPAGGEFSPLDAEASAAPPLDARGLGTLVHAVLAEIDFARPGDIAESVRRHAEQQLLEPERPLDEAAELVGRFLDSPRAAEIAAAKEVYRELEFLLAWPPEGCEAATGGREQAADAISRVSSTACTAMRPASGGWSTTRPIVRRPIRWRRWPRRTRCRCSSTRWPSSRFWNIRRKSWCCVFSGPGWNTVFPGTPPPGSAWWNW